MRRKLLASLLAIVMVISLLPATVLAADFSDTSGHWGEAAINRWADVGILNGKGEGNFDPNGSMTRAEFAQMLATMMGYTARVPNNFSDVPAGAWYEDAMLKLVAAGVLSGNGDGTATPNDPITREQAAVLLCRAFNLEPSRNASLNYQDSGSISSWARDAMAALAERGMMNGVGDNTAAPQLNINRASVAMLADNMIAEYVTESKTITGRVDGIILVAGGASVNLDNATVSEPVIIAPKASGVSVNLTGNTTADDIVIEANSARVSVGANASASSVKAESNSASVSVAGTVSSVDVTGTNGKVTVTGSVGTVSTEATGTSITVSGTVTNVDIGENASRASVTASAGGKIDRVTTEASNVTVSGNGTVGSVTATGGSVDVTTKGTEVTNSGADKVTAGDKTVSSGKTETSTGGSTSSGGDDDSGSGSAGTITPGGDPYVDPNPAKVVAAPLADHDEEHPISNIDNALGTVTVASKDNGVDQQGHYQKYEVTLTGNNIMLHKAETGSGGPKSDGNAHWVGFGIPLSELDVLASAVTHSTVSGGTYTFTAAVGETAAPTGTIIPNTRTFTEGGQTYQSVYVAEETDGHYETYTIAAYTEATTEITDPTTGITDTITGNVLVAAYTVKVDASTTFWTAKSANAVTFATTSTDAAKPGIAAVVSDGGTKTFTYADSKWTLTLTGALDPSVANFVDETTKDGNAYYLLEITDSNIAKVNPTTPSGVTDKGIESETDVVVAGIPAKAKIYNESVEDNPVRYKVTHVYELKDAADRVQDTITVVVDATGCSVDGYFNVSFQDPDGNDVDDPILVKSGEKPTFPTTPDNDTAVGGYFYTGEWYKSDDNAKTPVDTGDVTVVADTTFIARGIKIQAQKFDYRPEGPGGVKLAANGSGREKEINDFDYEAAYGKAGISLSSNSSTGVAVIEVVKDTLLAYVRNDAANEEGCTAADHTLNYYHLLGYNTKQNDLQFGASYELPDVSSNPSDPLYNEATKSIIATVTCAMGSYNSEGFKELHDATITEEAGTFMQWTDLVAANPAFRVYPHTLLQYYGVATVTPKSESASAGITAATTDTGEENMWLWADRNGKILAVTYAKINVEDWDE